MELPTYIMTDIMCTADMDADSLRQDYSGRGMYGKTCPSITVDSVNDLFQFMVAAGLLAEEEHVGYDVFNAMWLAAHACTDSMGLGTVVYWPDLVLTED